MCPPNLDAMYYIEDRKVDGDILHGKRDSTSLVKVLPFVLIIFGIMGSLYGGWATPSEAAGLGAVLSLFFVMTIYKIYRPRQLWGIFIKALNESSMILMIMASALLFAYVSSDLYATQALGELILKLPIGKWGVIILINILLLILGFFIPPGRCDFNGSASIDPHNQGTGIRSHMVCGHHDC